jgi:hypothetical protein
MGALTGNTVQSTYLDLVQLGQSGAGLPAHGGKEAAIYDGSGAQILGRTAVRHWLDPHPDAASFDETWEFSTTGDMTQGQLETAGWTFTDCSAEVSNGILWITTGAGAYPWMKAYYSTSLTGDFDLVMHLVNTEPGDTQVSTASNFFRGGLAVVDSSGDVTYQSCSKYTPDRSNCHIFLDGKWSDGTGSSNVGYNFFRNADCIRIWRISGTLYLAAGPPWPSSSLSRVAIPWGWAIAGSKSTAATFDIISLMTYVAQNSMLNSSAKWGVHSIRRFQ